MTIATTFAEANARYQRAAQNGQPKPKSPPRRPPPVNLLYDFAAAHLRLVMEGRVRRPVANHRLTVCSGLNAAGERVSDPCPSYNAAKDRCTACGCPDWPIARMRRKVWYPGAICPLGRFGDAPGRRQRIASGSEPALEPSVASASAEPRPQ